jgi:DNA-binding transcriptional MerR regulator
VKPSSAATQAERYTVSELAARSGVTIASIKFYLRAGLLAPGDLRAEKKAYYDARHLRRLVLIRALRELARLPVDKVRRLTRLIDRGKRSTFDLVASVIDALATLPEPRAARERRVLRERLHAKLRARGLEVRRESATLDALAAALQGLRAFDPALDSDVVDGYLDHLLPLAEAEFAAQRERLAAGAESAITGAVIGTVLYEPLILGLRRIAHEHFARRMFDR